MFTTDNFEKLHTPIESILRSVDPNRSFVVCDIDDTVLYPLLNGAEHPHGMFVRDTAVDMGIPVYYITARSESPHGRKYAIQQLEFLGIESPVVIMRPPSVNTWVDISRYKKASRQMLEEVTGRVCIMNVGDQWTDLMQMESFNLPELMDDMFNNQYVLYKNNSDKCWSVKLVAM